MEELLPHYERELALLRRSLQDFAARYPKIAARLAIAGEHSEDPHVERMLQSFALLAARIDVKLEDDYPDFTEPLLEVLYPQYLRPFPSCCIAQFRAQALHDKLTAPVTIERGTTLVAKAADCRFRSAYDVTLAPLCIAHAGYMASPVAPTGITLPADTSGLISLAIASTKPPTRLDAAAPSVLRLYLNGTRETTAALADALLLSASAAFAEADGSGKWKRLEQLPISAVGFDDADALMAGFDDTPPAFRLLMEHFAFAQKFDFVDIDLLALLRAAGPCQRVTLHLALQGVHQDGWQAQRLAKIGADAFQPFCTPVVNLFKRELLPIKINPEARSYALSSAAPDGSESEVFSIDAVYTVAPAPARKTMLLPLHSLMHGRVAKPSEPYWVARCDRWHADPSSRSAVQLAFVGLDGAPVATAFGQVGVDATYTNADLPASLPIGMPGGDLQIDEGEFGRNVAMLSRPTRSARLPRGNGALWRLIAHMTPHALHLSQPGLDAFKQLFRQFTVLAPSQTRHIDGISSLDYRTTMQWLAMEPSPAFVRGIELAITVDEQAFAACSLHTFASVMERLFAPYAPATSFVQVVLVSKNTGAEIRRCPPREGVTPLL